MGNLFQPWRRMNIRILERPFTGHCKNLFCIGHWCSLSIYVGREEGKDSPVTTFLDESAAEDLDHMEKYVLARRFLRFHLTKSWRQRLKDSDVAETWASIEKVCSLAKRYVARSCYQ
ncbi:hypothetical protein GQ600_6362 [Phytophthora cactorum]|nr:hypothetical protein GQ600_6362 [Phytophthora cactorum]